MAKLDVSAIETLVDWLRQTRELGGTIFTMGNGGSSSTASHWVNDLVKGASYQKGQKVQGDVSERFDCYPDRLQQ
jgi:D-sedoheptulose 7-phosphate isomerase